MSHRSEFRANVTNVALSLPVAGTAPIVIFDVGAAADVAEPGAGRSSTIICSPDEAEDGEVSSDEGSLWFLFPFPPLKMCESGIGGFGIDEDEVMKKRTMMPCRMLSEEFRFHTVRSPTKNAKRT